MQSYKVVALSVMLLLASSAIQAAGKNQKPFPEELAAKIVQDYSIHVQNTYAELLKANNELKSAIEAFTKNPSEETQNSAKQKWIFARNIYSSTEAFRFYGGPIDDAETGPEGLMNAWPLDEAYIDYVKEDSKAGIINNPKLYPRISKETLISLNEKNGEKNISTGYHAIEFLLWGQDFDLKSAGKRSFEDYVKEKNLFAERRATYIKLLADLLVEHSQQLEREWDPAVKGNFREHFLKEPKKEAVQKIFMGIGTLATDEMSGERMTVPLEKNDQENEQNCFSDTTASDLVSNQVGIMSIYSGNYTGFKGAGLDQLLKVVDAKSEAKIDQQMNKVLSKLKSIKITFDNLIMEKKNSPGKKLANQIIDDLQIQSKLLAKSISQLGMDINIEF